MRKLSAGWTDIRTDRQRDDGEHFIGRCPTKVERPTETFVPFSTEKLKKIMLKGSI